jgi:signal transduction histidine kinase
MELLKKENQLLETILNRNPNIIIVIKNDEVVKTNSKFHSFFSRDSIPCNELFQIIFLANHNQDTRKFSTSKEWINYLMNEQKDEKVLKIFKNQIPFYFIITIDQLEDDNYLITLQDITQVKENETITIKQSKMKSMGEMLSNIAHQWRQPLSMVSTLSTGLMAQKEMGMLSDEKLELGLENINSSVQYMSKVIDEFSSFYQVDKEKTEFTNTKLVDDAIKLTNTDTKSSITIVTKIKETTMIGLEKEIVQVIYNMIDNAKEILFERNINPKIIKIESYETKENVMISVHDNGNGIPEDLREKVFEPYFTTKHQKQGVGIGLYMSYEIINFYMDGYISVENKPFEHDGESYFGAKFIITLPKEIED